MRKGKKIAFAFESEKKDFREKFRFQNIPLEIWWKIAQGMCSNKKSIRFISFSKKMKPKRIGYRQRNLQQAILHVDYKWRKLVNFLWFKLANLERHFFTHERLLNHIAISGKSSKLMEKRIRYYLSNWPIGLVCFCISGLYFLVPSRILLNI